jgi:HEAT repeat protein
MVGNRDLPVAEDLAALLLKNRARPETATRLITLLGGLGRTDCLPPLLAALKDPEYPYRRTVLSAVEDILVDSNPPASSGVTNELMRCAPEIFTNAMNTSSGPAGK